MDSVVSSLAESEFKILLGNFLRRYKIKIELETGDELKWRDYLTCIVDGKVKAVVEPRD